MMLLASIVGKVWPSPRLLTYAFGFFGLLLCAVAIAPDVARADANPNKAQILVLSGGDQAGEAEVEIIHGLRQELKAKNQSVELWVRFLEVERAGTFGWSRDTLFNTPSLDHFDVLVAMDQAALAFLDARAEKIRSGAIVFRFHVDDDTQAQHLSERNDLVHLTLPLAILLEDLIQRVLALLPSSSQVFVLTAPAGQTRWSGSIIAAVEKRLGGRANLRNWRGVSDTEFRRWSRSLPENGVVIMAEPTIVGPPKAGGPVILDQVDAPWTAFALLDRASGAQQKYNRGSLAVLGGRMASGLQHGRAMGWLIANSLNGIPTGMDEVALNHLYPLTFFEHRIEERGLPIEAIDPANISRLNDGSTGSQATNVSKWVAFGLMAMMILLGFAALWWIARLMRKNWVLSRQGRFTDQVIETSGALLCVIDREGRIVTFNQACEFVSGYSRRQLLGEKLIDTLVIPEEREALTAILDDLHGGATPIEFETYWQTRGGARRLISWLWTARSSAEGGFDYAVATGSDITEHQRIVSDLALTSDRMAAILDTAVEGIVTIDQHGIVQSANRAAQEMFQYSEDEMRGRNVSMLMPEPYHSNHDSFLDNYLRTGVPKIIGSGREVRGKRKDGNTFPMDLGIAEWSQHGQRFFTGMIRDISERVVTEEALRRSQKMEAVGQLTGGIAHDFNNVLGVLIGNLDLIEDKIPDGDPIARLVTSAQKAVIRGADLTRRLLAFSRQSSGPAEPVNLAEIIGGMADILDKSLTKDISVDYRLADDLWPVKADTGDLETTILNLAINARDAMPDGGRFVIEAANKALPVDHKVPGLDHGEYVVMSFIDTGLGMAEDVQAQVFEPFFSTKPQSQGTGLGLSIIYSFVQRMNGHIGLQSELGRGTTIEIYLPRSRETPKPAILGQDQRKKAETGSETVLVVDDEPEMLETCARALVSLGYDVITAVDTSHALDILYGEEHIDLLVTDVVMPGDLNGFELATIATAQRPNLRVLMTSGFVKGVEDTDRYKGVYQELLIKPYRREDLAVAVRRILGPNVDTLAPQD